MLFASLFLGGTMGGRYILSFRTKTHIIEISATGFSIHPLFAVSDKYNAYRELADVFLTLEGPAGKLTFMQAWLQGIGLQVRIIPAEVNLRLHSEIC